MAEEVEAEIALFNDRLEFSSSHCLRFFFADSCTAACYPPAHDPITPCFLPSSLCSPAGLLLQGIAAFPGGVGTRGQKENDNFR